MDVKIQKDIGVFALSHNPAGQALSIRTNGLLSQLWTEEIKRNLSENITDKKRSNTEVLEGDTGEVVGDESIDEQIQCEDYETIIEKNQREIRIKRRLEFSSRRFLILLFTLYKWMISLEQNIELNTDKPQESCNSGKKERLSKQTTRTIEYLL